MSPPNSHHKCRQPPRPKLRDLEHVDLYDDLGKCRRQRSHVLTTRHRPERRPSLWVPNWPSTAVTCDIAVRWSSGMIVGRGGTTAVPDLPAGHGVAGTAGS